MTILNAVVKNPKYVLMRGVGRFRAVRDSIAIARRLIGSKETARYESVLNKQMSDTIFTDTDRGAFLSELGRSGCSFGLTLSNDKVRAIKRYAAMSPVFAYREESKGFFPQDRINAETALGRQILLAQYFNAERNCQEISEIARDPLLNWVALKYLGSVPKYLGCNLWWTYPVRAIREDQVKHAHFFHRDIDDFKFLKFFFYLTDVQSGDGAHWVVRGSHKIAPHVRLKDFFLTRRFEDDEVLQYYSRSNVVEVVGSEGDGFAEDTLCVHKAASPTRMPRLVLQLQFALFDFGVGNDSRPPSDLKMIKDDHAEIVPAIGPREVI